MTNESEGNSYAEERRLVKFSIYIKEKGYYTLIVHILTYSSAKLALFNQRLFLIDKRSTIMEEISL